jgi:cysteine desulfurase
LGCNCRHLQKLKEARVSIDEPSAVYMDYNAACPPDSAVLAHYQNTAMKIWAHPDSPHLAGQKALDHMEDLEKKWKNISSMEEGTVKFCRGSSDAISLFYQNIRRTPNAVITGCCEHNTVLEQSESYCRTQKIPFIQIPVDTKGRLNPDKLRFSLKQNPESLFIYSAVNHETGAIQDCALLWEICTENNARVFMDAPQAMARLQSDLWMPYTHGYSMSGQKIYGIKGTGVCVLKPELELCDDQTGNAGTPDIAGASSLTRAMELYKKDLPELLNYWRILCREGIQILSAGDFELTVLSPEENAEGILCISVPNLLKCSKNMEDLFYHLNREGIFLSRFSACTGSVIGNSHILDQMGFSNELSSSSLRISLGRKSKRDDFFRLRKALNAFFILNTE